MKDAIQIYKELFEPSEILSKPYVIVCLNAIVADTDEQAEYLATTQAQVMVSITRGRMQPVQPPTDDLRGLLTPTEYEIAKQRMQQSLIGSEETVKAKIQDFIKEHGEIDELMAISYIYNQDEQLNSYKKLKTIVESL
ncbi:oxidoreductase [Staphylococcus aureus]|nr:oxidoreductase [Staphylococcus aureus]